MAFEKAGTCIVDARQAGNSEYAAAPQMQQAITVTAAKASTATTIALSLPTIAYGSEQVEKVTVTTTAAGGGTIAAGKATIKSGAKTVCKATLVDGTGSCSPKVKALKAGSYFVTATFSKTSKFGGSTSSAASLEVT